MLKNYKDGKIIILTTHYMDEADFLGDRIAVMTVGGVVETCGSPMFLKQRFGEGYSLKIQKRNADEAVEGLDDTIGEIIPNAKLVSEVSAEVVYSLPLEDRSKFA
jgi:ABC-type multidrug transport system ATPase subunit